MQNLGLLYKFVHKDKDGNIIEESDWLENHITDDGLEQLYDVYFRGAAAPDSDFEVGLNTLSLAQTSSYVDLTEVTGTGYAREALTRDSTATGFPTLTLDSGDMQVTSATVTFENTGSSAWDEAVDGFLVSNDVGDGYVLISFRPLSTARTLQSGDTLEITVVIKGTQPA